jgi:hypothetical protein
MKNIVLLGFTVVVEIPISLQIIELKQEKNAAQTGGVELFAGYILISAGWGGPPE